MKRSIIRLSIVLIFMTVPMSKAMLPARLSNMLGRRPMKLAHNTARPTFGRTHFIAGYQQKDLPSVVHQRHVQRHNSAVSNVRDVARNVPDVSSLFQPSKEGRIQQALFAPDDDVRSALLQLIDSEQESIHVAVYSFTEREVAHALAGAKKRGVHVEIITDTSCLQNKYNKVYGLAQQSVPVFVYNLHPAKKMASGSMHNKFALFGKNMNNKPLVWTGSFNFTRAGHKENQENVLVLNDDTVVKRYIEQFKRLKARCQPFNAQ